MLVAAVLPTKIINLGLTIAMCFSTNGLQITNSSDVGLRLAGGRQNTVLVIYTFLVRDKLMDCNILSSNLPLSPQKGIPCLSSFCPGASPISIIGADGIPSPNTVFNAVFLSKQPSKEVTDDFKSSNVCTLSASCLEFDNTAKCVF
ncbi:Uncharacterised protein [Orientia tsutsugamushi]|uniref:Uncharacterized protein n=1 Tax=Orientia tsutsugamushi TaxID=784 RepID=A0A2R8F0A0_ORITS|nr:Uncharacterised protein [Orientia tsutsugamushi]